MASTALNVAGPKKSFASVAAMAPGTSSNQVPSRDPLKTGIIRKKENLAPLPAVPSSKPPVLNLEGSIARLDVKDDLPSTSSASPTETNAGLQARPRLEDEKSHLSFSSTKPASVDGRSVTSGTTFAMDEKESLRPDDSASLKAAEEDDSNSGPVSGAPSSRVGSETGGRAFRDQFNEISERIGPTTQRPLSLGRKLMAGLAEEGSPGLSVPLPSSIPISTTMPGPEAPPASGAPFVYKYQGPDEKLIEAMDSPKDRLFLLQLEQRVISFIRDSQELILDLPPCNSFCRLLAHRLGDYYALTHYVDNNISAVRLYRTPYCRLPTPLATFTKQTTTTEVPLSAQSSMKIMRRNGITMDGMNTGSGANTTTSSLGPSKTGSETGDDGQRVSGVASPTDSISTKDKASMTREEREAMYKEARDRIFKDFEDSETTEVQPSAETPNETSRTSSTNGKKKTKKKINDDGFEARSSYNAYYPAMQYAGPSYNSMANTMIYPNPFMQQTNTQMQYQGHQQPYNQGYPSVQPIHSYPMHLPPIPMTYAPGSYSPSLGQQSFVPYGPQVPQQYYQPIPQQNQMLSQTSGMSSPSLSFSNQSSRPQSQMSDEQWSQPPTNYQPSYQNFQGPSPMYPVQGQQHLQAPTTPTNVAATPYPYGQLPYHPNVPGGRSPHPLPGSFSRQTFNPETRAFIPGSHFAASQPNNQTSRQGDQPGRMGYLSPPNHQAGTGTSAYGQPPLNNFHGPAMNPLGHFVQPRISTPHIVRKVSNNTTTSQPPGQSSLAKWGTPATLPPKPPPSEASSRQSSGTHRVAPDVPTFQNGTYSKPSTGQN